MYHRRPSAKLRRLWAGCEDEPDLADASNVVLAGGYSAQALLTLEERRFRAATGPGDEPFRTLPAG